MELPTYMVGLYFTACGAISAAIALRLAHLFLTRAHSGDDERAAINKRIKHTLIAGAIMISIWAFVEVFKTALGGIHS